jgi:hypothetical protein
MSIQELLGSKIKLLVAKQYFLQEDSKWKPLQQLDSSYMSVPFVLQEAQHFLCSSKKMKQMTSEYWSTIEY